MVSDFISAPGWERPLKLLSQRHEVLAVRLWDPREIELPDIGVIVLEDAETGETWLLDTADEGTRRAFSKRAQQGRGGRQKLFRSMNVDQVEINTRASYVEPLIRFFAKVREWYGHRPDTYDSGMLPDAALFDLGAIGVEDAVIDVGACAPWRFEHQRLVEADAGAPVAETAQVVG